MTEGLRFILPFGPAEVFCSNVWDVKMKKISLIALLGLLGTLSFASREMIEPAVIFVDRQLPSDCTSGNYSIDQRDCSGSDANAYNTIQKAATVVSPGDTVQVRAGTYLERVTIPTSGTVDAYITFRNYLAERPVIDGQKTLPSGNGLVFLQNRAYIQIIGFTITDSQYYGIQATDGSHHIVVQDCEVMYSNHGGMVFDGGSNITIDNCDVHHNNDLGLSAWHEAITLNGVDTFEVKHSRVYHNKEEGIDAKYGSTNGRIHDNEVYSNNGPNIYVDAANNLNIFSNRIYNTTGQKPGIMLSVEENPNRYVTFNINIYNNLIYDNDSGIGFWIGPRAKRYGFVSDSTIINNTIHSNNANGGLWIVNVGQLSYRNIVLRNNIFLDNDTSGQPEVRDSTGGQVQNFTIDHNLFRTGANSHTYGTDYVTTGDPGFADLTNHDYHLESNSPAVDTGGPTAAPLIDFDGRPRPSGAGYDIGAYEFQGTETTITSAPANPSASSTASFSFTAPQAGSTFECRLDGTGFIPCQSPTTYSDLAEGSHIFQVQAIDPAGNRDLTPASYAWTVDPTAPVISSVLASNIKTVSATIRWQTNEPADTQVEYGTTASLGQSTTLNTTLVTSHVQSLSGLSAKTTYYYRVRSRDAAGNLAVSDASSFRTR